MGDEEYEGEDFLSGMMENLTPGVTRKVAKNAPQYLIDDYNSAMREMREIYESTSPAGFSSEEEWMEAVSVKLAESGAIIKYKDAMGALMNILKVSIALEIVLVGEVTHDHDE